MPKNKQQEAQEKRLQRNIRQAKKARADAKTSGNKTVRTRPPKKGGFFAGLKTDAPQTVQQSIPYKEMYRDGICRLTDKLYTKTVQFFDINYQLAQADDKAQIFEGYCDFLNYFDASIHVQLTFINQRANIDMNNHRVLCFQLKSLGKALKEIGLLIMQDAVWNRVTANRSKHKTTWFYIDEFHLLLKGQTGSFSVEIWKRFRKWGGIPSGLTQNVKDLLASREIENIFENSDFIYMLNQAQGDRQILAKQLGISPHQLSYVTHSGPGEGLLFFGNVIIPFISLISALSDYYNMSHCYGNLLSEK